MGLLKRALISVRRSPGKSLTLLLLVVILGVVISGTISIRNAIHTTDLNLRQSMRPVVVPVEDWEAIVYEWDVLNNWDVEAFPLSPEIIYEIGNLPYVDYFDYSMFKDLRSFDLNMWLPVPRERVTSHFGILDSEIGEQFMVRGVSHSDFLDIRQGFVELVDGESFTDLQLQNGDYVAVVSSKWAEYNGLSVGDVFSLDNVIFLYDEVGGFSLERFAYQVYEFEIIGLFDVIGIEELGLVEIEALDFLGSWGLEEMGAIQRANNIYLPNTIIREMVYFFNENWQEMLGFEEEEERYWMLPVFVLYDPLDTIAFREAAMPLLPDFWLLSDLSNRFEPISLSMESMRGISDGILLIAIGASLVVLGLTITLFLHDRRHEVGIYLALGERRMAIIWQILIEIIVIAVIGVTLSILIGNHVANGLSQNMLETELADVRVGPRGTLDPTIDRLEALGFGPPLEAEEMLEFYDFSLNPQTVVLFYVISLATVIATTAMPIFYLTRLSPKKVLL